MFKVMWLLKRKEGITHAQFRDHYERNHAELAKKYFGNLMVEYRRNYRTSEADAYAEQGGNMEPVALDFDCIAEWVLPNKEAFDEINRLFSDPVISTEFHNDALHFLDGGGGRMFTCETIENGSSITLALSED
jgi:hypothetical protein